MRAKDKISQQKNKHKVKTLEKLSPSQMYNVKQRQHHLKLWLEMKDSVMGGVAESQILGLRPQNIVTE